jgi:chaperonin GroES
MIKINLLNNKVLIKPIEKNTTTTSGFILPEDNKEDKIREGEVVAVGDGKYDGEGDDGTHCSWGPGSYCK